MVKPKKHLGQHFLKDEGVSERISDSLTGHGNYEFIIEIGPGTGALTKYLLNRKEELLCLEVDQESIQYLNKQLPKLKVLEQDFLKFDLSKINKEKIAIAGNFPYNISSQILFKVLEDKGKIFELVGMFQKEVAERVAAGPGTKKYGILSVLIQAYYEVEYLFTVDENVFNPPPKVKSGVIRLQRRDADPACNEHLLRKLVKITFNQRRKMIRNTIKILLGGAQTQHPLYTKRPEQLSVQDFIDLTNFLESHTK
tara:strand:- start:1323 stop:2084 length:762 start_codon:yes stop_codon:yes gene_type:complete